jgi:hypothetical protein
MEKFLLIVFATVLISLNISAQGISSEEIKYFKSSYSQNVSFIADESLKGYIETVVGLHKRRDGFYGYRVKIFADNSRNARDRANNLRVSFNNQQDTVQAYVVYQEPNFEVHVGDYRTRFEAVALLNKLESKYPEAYVIRTIVKFPRL